MDGHLISWSSIDSEAGSKGVTRRRLKGAGAELVRVEIPAGVAAAAHSHSHEQFVDVLRGSGTLTTPNGSRPFKAGDVFHFPPHTEHAASFDSDTVFLEINLP